MVVCFVCVVDLLCIFFFKQKTAYEMRISDWSSDVCSSDLDLVTQSYFLSVRILHSAYQLAKGRTVTQPGCGLPIIGQQVRELACGVRADAGDDIGEVGLRVEAIEPGRLNQRVAGVGAPAAGIGSGNEVVGSEEGRVGKE